MIILTGASGGIGKELLEHFTKIDKVLGIYNTSLPSITTNEKLEYEKVDLEDSTEIKSFAAKWGPKLSKITIVHIAVSKKDDLAVNCREEDWDRSVRVNLKANFLLNQALLPFMIKEHWGRIVHISSLGGIQGRPGTIAYSTTKAGLIGLSNVLAKEYARFGITSNVLILGYFGTRLFYALKEIEQKRIMDSIPSKTLGDVSNIANAVEFLIKSEYVNGSSINIDGGAR